MMKLMRKRASILSTTLRTRSDDYKAELVKEVGKCLLPHFEDGKLKLIIEKEFKITEVAQALK